MLSSLPIFHRQKEVFCHMRLQTRLAIACAKLANIIIRITIHKKGGTFPGYLARLIKPDILPALCDMVHGKIIVTMGTNGKTTVNNILYQAISAEGKKVLSNSTGANMINGITAAFVLAADRKGGLDIDYACIEVDELAALQVLPMLRPDCVLLTNIFRDQLDRFGEVDAILNKIKEALFTVPDARLIINCDDSLLAALASLCPNPVITYGINEQIFDSASRPPAPESLFCRVCGAKLDYDYFHYGQLGSYQCPCCGWQRPKPDFTAEKIVLKQQGYSFDLKGVHIDSCTDFPYNIYNILSAHTALCAENIPTERFALTMNTLDYGNHREEHFFINGSHVRLHLAKNPVGLQQKISLIQRDCAPKDIIFQINDRLQDGTDLSWLWDVNVTYLKTSHISSITVLGKRRHDMALRLKYDDIPCACAKSLKPSVWNLSLHGTGNIYIIVNYSGLLSANTLLRKLQRKSQLCSILRV